MNTDFDEDFEPLEQDDSIMPSLDETFEFSPLTSENIDDFFNPVVAEEKIEPDNVVVEETNKEEQKEVIQPEVSQNIFPQETKVEPDIKINNESKQEVFPQENNKENVFSKETVQIEETPQNIFSTEAKIESDNVIKAAPEEFSNEFNKLKKEEEILNMNKELSLEGLTKEKPYTKYMALLPIFAFFFTSFLGVYLFSLNSKAEGANLIKVEQNNKVGYIDESGNKVVNTKYTSGTDFYKGYAIVKNQNNLSAVINGKGSLNSSFGEYFYIERYGNRYVASKFTNEGLKLALLDSKLNELTRYKYDNITYVKNNAFLFTKDDTMGVLNYNGKEVYSYTVDEVDNKNISIEVSKVNDDKIKDRYAMIKVNNSSTIINLLTGEEVYKYTLDDIYVLENNVFYIKPKKSDNYRYMILKNNSIVYETSIYKNVKRDNFESNILLCFKDNSSIDYINLNTSKVINENQNIDYYYGDGIILEKKHDFNINKDVYTISNSNKTLGKFEDIKPVDGKFSNGLLKVYVDNEKYNFINKKGSLINNRVYDEADDFNEFGYSIVSSNNLYGVLNSDGEEVVKSNYDKIEYLNDDLFKLMKEKYNKELFIYYKNGKCGLIDSKGNIAINSGYDKFKYITSKYPIIIGKYEKEDILINLENEKDLKIQATKDVSIHENYIINNDKYYNYDGKLIYDKSKEV